MVAAKSINGSVTGLRIAEELPGQIGVVDGTAVWLVYEPNTYGEFGAEITTLAREPIVTDRQSKKGMVTDLDASGGFVNDLTQFGIADIMQGFMFADYRVKNEFGGAGEITSTTAVGYVAASGLDAFPVGSLVVARGFSNAVNNGLKEVTASIAALLTTTPSPIVEAAPPATATLVEIGVVAGTGDIDVDAAGAFPALTSTVLDFTTLGLIPGEWVFRGGDAAGSFFATAANNGFGRIRTITATRLEFDKSPTTMVTETGSGLDIHLYFGRHLKNETGTAGSGAEIVRRTYQAERTLGAPDTALPTEIQSDYLVGCVANTLALSIGTADKVPMDIGLIGLDAEQRTGAVGLKAGSRPNILDSTAFNTSSDFTFMRVTPVDETTGTPLPVFGFMTQVDVTIDNNSKPNKAIGTLGGFEMTVGKFMVTGEIEAYFSNISAVQAVRNNASVTLDMALVKENAGIVFDLPLITLGNGRLSIEQDESIKIPVSFNAASGSQIVSTLDHTLSQTWFDYLPDLAE